MTKKQELEVIERRINWLIEKEINDNQSDWERGWDAGYKSACEQILKMIKSLK